MDWIEQYEAARHNVAICRVAKDEIVMDGADAVSVLHKLCSNDIQALAENHGAEAFICTVQGKIVGHVLAYRTATGLRLSTEAGQAAELIAHLDRYVIREDVAFEHLENAHSLFVLGAQATAALNAIDCPCPQDALQATQWNLDDGQTLTVRRIPDLNGYQIVGGLAIQSCVESPLTESGAPTMNREAFEALRIESFVPKYGVDISTDNLPQEVGRDATAISFTKGCYLGQETVARIDAMGHVNWILRGVRFSGDTIPPAGEKLQVDGKDVARVTSACYSPQLRSPLALAYVRRQQAADGTELTSALGKASVVELPWVVETA